MVLSEEDLSQVQALVGRQLNEHKQQTEQYQARIAALEEEVQDLKAQLEQRNQLSLSTTISPSSVHSLSEMSLPPPSLENEALESWPQVATSAISPKLPSLIHKVSSKVQRMWPSHSPAAESGPLTVRRNTGMSRIADSMTGQIVIPEAMKQGINFLRVTHNKKVQRVLRLDESSGIVSWNNKSSSQFSLDRICEIYTGEGARNYREEFKVSSELGSRWATIIHQRRGDTKLRALHIIVPTQKEFDMLINCLIRLVSFRREIMSGLTRAGQNFVDVYWSRSRGDKEKLSFGKVQTLSRQLHVNCSRDYLRKLFDEADADNSEFLDFSEFQRFVRLLKRRDDIIAIFKELAPSGAMNKAGLTTFLTKVQKQSFSANEIDNLFFKFASPLTDSIGEDQFVDLLVSSSMFPVTSDENEDLDRPLDEYWISSSHNTYLLGRQVADGSSVEAYIRALQDGCRCIEIDCWDGPAGPLVCHGNSLTRLTGAIEFTDVIQAVLKFGFISSPYPLILSLEVHCSEANQQKMVATMKTILGENLVTAPLLPGSFSLPSPAELKHKILIKVKATTQPTISDSMSSSSSATDVSDDLSRSPKKTPPPKPMSRVIPELASLGVYLSTIKFRNFALPESKTMNHCFSFAERTLRLRLKDPEFRRQLIKHNTKYLMRVYPSAYRINSSNFDPIPFWRLGIQMVALNWQTVDIGMQLNCAFHSPRIGYVLKPLWMRPARVPVQPPQRGHTVEVVIISAQQLPRPKELKPEDDLNPYVSLEVFGMGDMQPQWKTPAVYNNGYNPQWNYKCQFTVSEEDLPFTCLKFSVLQADSSFAIYTAKLTRMHEGFRHLPLQDLHGEDYIFSSLFIKLDMS